MTCRDDIYLFSQNEQILKQPADSRPGFTGDQTGEPSPGGSYQEAAKSNLKFKKHSLLNKTLI